MQKSMDDKKRKSECVSDEDELATNAYYNEEYTIDELRDKRSQIGAYRNKKLAFTVINDNIDWTLIQRPDLNLKYGKIPDKHAADAILKQLEEEIQYFDGELTRVKVFGKWHNIPRKQVVFGEEGLSYTFSGISLPAKPWDACPVVKGLQNYVELVTGECFNFVLINRYKDGNDHMGEHRDNEKELNPDSPIVSLSFGEERPFVFKHKDSRGKNSKLDIAPLKIQLEPGSILVMEKPTNEFWYHSLPVRKNIKGVRVNLTFRQMIHVKKH
ncbi:hypothetical protein JTE90_014779 [Oedothorax gibbosus]|uniref:DNA oxidative demethylase ALKBH2 n=1 Tax=Oedothorax gibbosus TaxID=931172 RepID=A0AAV6UAA2_9ARAC|nr:hypothetical protein JTE90_014779 [Oedothorax gibbosus]